MKFSNYLIIMMQMLWRQLALSSFPGNTGGKIEWHNQTEILSNHFQWVRWCPRNKRELLYNRPFISELKHLSAASDHLTQLCLPHLQRRFVGWVFWRRKLKKKMFYPRWFSKHTHQLHFIMDRMEDQKISETEDLLCTVISCRKTVLELGMEKFSIYFSLSLKITTGGRN